MHDRHQTGIKVGEAVGRKNVLNRGTHPNLPHRIHNPQLPLLRNLHRIRQHNLIHLAGEANVEFHAGVLRLSGGLRVPRDGRAEAPDLFDVDRGRDDFDLVQGELGALL